MCYNIGMGKFDLFNKFNSAVIVIGDNKETVFTNNVFKRFFKDFDNVKKFSHKLDYDVYPLESNNMAVLSPLLQAFNSKEDFSAHVKYMAFENNVFTPFYFDMSSTKKGKYTVIILTDVTAKVKLASFQKQNQTYKTKVDFLEEENKSLSKVKLLAQSQAMKLLLLNNISNIIRGSINISVILKSALKELSEMFGAFRGYYAEMEGQKFIIKESIISSKIHF